MEIYIYGTVREVTLAKEILQREFPFVKAALPVFDRSDESDQQHCRIHIRRDDWKDV